METLLIGFSDGLVRASVNGSASAEWSLRGVPVPMTAADPRNPGRIYAATLGEGLQRSDDGGRTFRRLPGLAADLVWAVVVSVSDHRDGNGVVYVGTQPSALHRSEDGGETFDELTSVQELPSKPQWAFPPAPDTHHVHQITLDIEDPDTIVFGVELGGVFCSRDRGASWTRTTADPDPHTLRTHPTQPARMYEGGGVAPYLSVDGGGSWERVLHGIPDEIRYFYSLAVDSGDPDNVIVSGARDPFSGHAVVPGMPVWSSLYRLADGAWHELTDGLPPRDGTAMGTLAAGLPGVFYYVTEPGEIYRSSDGGQTFALVAYDGANPGGNVARSVLVVDR